MPKTNITLRIEDDKRRAVDALAGSLDRDRSYILTQAIDAYLDLHAWQIEHMKKGLRQAESGQFASSAAVKRAFARWRR